MKEEDLGGKERRIKERKLIKNKREEVKKGRDMMKKKE